MALDAQGEPTDDPGKAFAGQWLPIGGAKGLGLSYAVDLLCGLITGGDFGLGMKSQFSQPTEPSGTGHLMIALRLDAVIAPDELQQRMEEFVADVKASPMRDASAEMLVPGETAHRTEVERRATGIPVPGERVRPAAGARRAARGRGRAEARGRVEDRSRDGRRRRSRHGR